MSDFQAYHGLAGQTNPDYAQQQSQQPPNARPPMAPHPQGAAYGNQPAPYPPSDQGYYNQAPQQDGSRGLASQMGSMTIGGDGSGTVRKKKDRHAYHNIQSAGSS